MVDHSRGVVSRGDLPCSSTGIVSRHNMAAKQNCGLVFVGYVLKLEAILKMTVAMIEEDGTTGPN